MSVLMLAIGPEMRSNSPLRGLPTASNRYKEKSMLLEIKADVLGFVTTRSISFHFLVIDRSAPTDGVCDVLGPGKGHPYLRKSEETWEKDMPSHR